MLEARDQAVAVIRDESRSSHSPAVVAIDGGSGAGKSTLAAWIAEELDAVVIPLDDFFAGDIPDPKWSEFSLQERLRKVFKWDAVREQVLKPLLSGEPAEWFAFDFESGLQADGTYGMEHELKRRQPADVILLEGTYSAGPQLSDLVDLTILVDAPVQERHARLDGREPPDFSEKWHAVWDEVEAYYFRQVRPEGSFDLVVRM